jgi:hypothetical protein
MINIAAPSIDNLTLGAHADIPVRLIDRIVLKRHGAAS